MAYLFTFILEYAGGTYISQYAASTVIEALQRWADGEIVNLGSALSTTVARRLLADIAQEVPIPLSKLYGAYCVSASVDSELALLNIVQTVRVRKARSGEPPLKHGAG